MDGSLKPVEQVPDEAFSEKLLGIGVAVMPDNGSIYSPVEGEITEITDTKHAYCITSDDGAEFLLHVGIDTVNLKGEGFSVLVKKGDRVTAGEKIAEVDLELLKNKGFCTDTPFLLTNCDDFSISETFEGNVKGGETAIFSYIKS